MPVSDKILILGGTSEAAALAFELVKKGINVTTSLAGRTKVPEPVSGKTRIGGFGGAEGLANWLNENDITKVIDATHPFAKQISRNAVEATGIAKIPIEIYHRAPWEKTARDNWHEVTNLADAAAAIPKGAHVFLALGSQHLQPFQNREDVYFLIRMVDEPLTPLVFPDHSLIIGKPSKNWQDEAQLLNDNTISHIVCRNSGGIGGFGKIEAARQLQLPVIIIGRPT